MLQKKTKSQTLPEIDLTICPTIFAFIFSPLSLHPGPSTIFFYFFSENAKSFLSFQDIYNLMYDHRLGVKLLGFDNEPYKSRN